MVIFFLLSKSCCFYIQAFYLFNNMRVATAAALFLLLLSEFFSTDLYTSKNGIPRPVYSILGAICYSYPEEGLFMLLSWHDPSLQWVPKSYQTFLVANLLYKHILNLLSVILCKYIHWCSFPDYSLLGCLYFTLFFFPDKWFTSESQLCLHPDFFCPYFVCFL